MCTCNCNCNSNPCTCTPTACGCSTQLSTVCVIYEGNNLESLGANTDDNLERILINLDAILLNLFSLVSSNPIGTNIGGGVELFVPATADFRTFGNTSSIEWTLNGDLLEAAISATWYTANIQPIIDNVATNTTDIATNTTDIATNTANIATNTANIAANTADIADIRTTQGTSDGDTNMGTYTGSLINDNESVKQNIQQLETQVEANVTGIADNVSDISDIRTTTGTLDGDTNMGTYTGSLINDNESTKQNIQQLETQVETNESDITTNAGNIATNTGNIASNAGNIASNAGTIATNTGSIATNASNISTNTTNIGTNTTNIGTNTTEIADIRTMTGSAAGETNLGTLNDPNAILTNSQDLKTNLQELSDAIAAVPISLTTGSATFEFYSYAEPNAGQSALLGTTDVKYVLNGKFATLYYSVNIDGTDFAALGALDIGVDLSSALAGLLDLDTSFLTVYESTAIARATTNNIADPYTLPVHVQVKQETVPDIHTVLLFSPAKSGAGASFTSTAAGEEYYENGVGASNEAFTVAGQITYLIS